MISLDSHHDAVLAISLLANALFVVSWIARSIRKRLERSGERRDDVPLTISAKGLAEREQDPDRTPRYRWSDK